MPIVIGFTNCVFGVGNRRMVKVDTREPGSEARLVIFISPASGTPSGRTYGVRDCELWLRGNA